jgi:peptidoglycan hydrolase-like protein with peptidoglycan-binding domain
MKIKAIATSALVASLSFAPISPLVTPARADGKDVIAGIIVGGIIGAAINEGSKGKSKSKSKSKSTKSPGMSAEQKAANIEVQQSLNYFGWNVGSADGVLGKKSRSAISEYQAFLGYPATGELDEEQRTILVTAHTRAMAGGSVIQEIVAGSVYGVRGVLLAQRDEMNAPKGVIIAKGEPAGDALPAGTVAAKAEAALPSLLPPTTTAPAAPVVATPAPVPTPAPAPAAPAPAPVVVAAEPAAPALPSFMDPNGAKGALSAECTEALAAVALKGGYDTAATMQDANAALTEQFCLSRAAAVSTGKALGSKVAGFTPEQIAAQCEGFGPVMKDHVAALSLKPEAEVLAGVEAFILQSGMSPAQLSGTAKVCLGVGYETDKLDIAIGSALLLTAMGETGYAELLGHHLSQGFGAAQRPDLAVGWYDVALTTLAGGADLFAPGVPGRADLIEKAAYTAAGRAGELAPEAKIEEAALPGFVVTPDAPAPAPVAEVAVAPAPVMPVATPAPEPAPAAVAVVEPAPAPAPLPRMSDVATVPAETPVTDAPAIETVAAESPAGEAMREGAQVIAAAAKLPLMFFAAY